MILLIDIEYSIQEAPMEPIPLSWIFYKHGAPMEPDNVYLSIDRLQIAP